MHKLVNITENISFNSKVFSTKEKFNSVRKLSLSIDIKIIEIIKNINILIFADKEYLSSNKPTAKKIDGIKIKTNISFKEKLI